MKAKSLRRGDRFSFIPAAWHGPGRVLESRASGDHWYIKFANSKVVNPPGIWYGDPNAQVTRLKRLV